MQASTFPLSTLLLLILACVASQGWAVLAKDGDKPRHKRDDQHDLYHDDDFESSLPQEVNQVLLLHGQFRKLRPYAEPGGRRQGHRMSTGSSMHNGSSRRRAGKVRVLPELHVGNVSLQPKRPVLYGGAGKHDLFGLLHQRPLQPRGVQRRKQPASSRNGRDHHGRTSLAVKRHHASLMNATDRLTTKGTGLNMGNGRGFVGGKKDKLTHRKPIVLERDNSPFVTEKIELLDPRKVFGNVKNIAELETLMEESLWLPKQNIRTQKSNLHGSYKNETRKPSARNLFHSGPRHMNSSRQYLLHNHENINATKTTARINSLKLEKGESKTDKESMINGSHQLILLKDNATKLRGLSSQRTVKSISLKHTEYQVHSHLKKKKPKHSKQRIFNSRLSLFVSTMKSMLKHFLRHRKSVAKSHLIHRIGETTYVVRKYAADLIELFNEICDKNKRRKILHVYVNRFKNKNRETGEMNDEATALPSRTDNLRVLKVKRALASGEKLLTTLHPSAGQAALANPGKRRKRSIINAWNSDVPSEEDTTLNTLSSSGDLRNTSVDITDLNNIESRSAVHDNSKTRISRTKTDLEIIELVLPAALKESRRKETAGSMDTHRRMLKTYNVDNNKFQTGHDNSDHIMDMIVDFTGDTASDGSEFVAGSDPRKYHQSAEVYNFQSRLSSTARSSKLIHILDALVADTLNASEAASAVKSGKFSTSKRHNIIQARAKSGIKNLQNSNVGQMLGINIQATQVMRMLSTLKSALHLITKGEGGQQPAGAVRTASSKPLAKNQEMLPPRGETPTEQTTEETPTQFKSDPGLRWFHGSGSAFRNMKTENFSKNRNGYGRRTENEMKTTANQNLLLAIMLTKDQGVESIWKTKNGPLPHDTRQNTNAMNNHDLTITEPMKLAQGELKRAEKLLTDYLNYLLSHVSSSFSSRAETTPEDLSRRIPLIQKMSKEARNIQRIKLFTQESGMAQKRRLLHDVARQLKQCISALAAMRHAKSDLQKTSNDWHRPIANKHDTTTGRSPAPSVNRDNSGRFSGNLLKGKYYSGSLPSLQPTNDFDLLTRNTQYLLRKLTGMVSQYNIIMLAGQERNESKNNGPHWFIDERSRYEFSPRQKTLPVPREVPSSQANSFKYLRGSGNGAKTIHQMDDQLEIPEFPRPQIAWGESDVEYRDGSKNTAQSSKLTGERPLIQRDGCSFNADGNCLFKLVDQHQTTSTSTNIRPMASEPSKGWFPVQQDLLADRNAGPENMRNLFTVMDDEPASGDRGNPDQNVIGHKSRDQESQVSEGPRSNFERGKNYFRGFFIIHKSTKTYPEE